MSSRRVLELRNRSVQVSNEVNDSSSNADLPSANSEHSESDISSLPDSDTDFASITEVEMANFDAKEAREAIPKFNGKNNFTQFLSICEDLFNDLADGESDAGLVRIIKQKLNNEAFTLCRNCTTYSEISKTLARKYGEDTPLSVLIKEMVNLRQKNFEDAKSYGDRAVLLQEKLNLISEELLKRSTIECKNIQPVEYIYSKVLLEYFINGIQATDVKNIVKANNFSDLAKAAEYTVSLEANYKSNQITSKFNGNQMPNNRNGFNGNNYNRNNYNQRNQNFSRPTIKKEPFNNNRPQVKTEPVGNMRAKPICNFCGKTGHIERDCFHRQRSQINVLESKNFKEPPNRDPDIKELELMRSLGI